MSYLKQKALAFENNKWLAWQLVIFITCLFFLIELDEIHETETFPDYFDNIKPYLETCDVWNIEDKRGALKWHLLCISQEVFGNERIIPFFFSIILIPITFGFITELSQRRLVGLIAVLVLVTSSNFILYNTTATYEQSWVVFMLLSFWLALRSTILLPVVFFILAFLSKPLALLYLPLALIMMKNMRHDALGYVKLVRDINLILFAIVFAVFTVAIILVSSSVTSMGNMVEFNFDELIAGTYNWFFLIGGSPVIAVLIPLILLKLGFMSKQKITHSQTIFWFILGIIISVPLIEGFTNQLNHSYRFVPLVIFGGAGLGMILANFLTPYLKRV